MSRTEKMQRLTRLENPALWPGEILADLPLHQTSISPNVGIIEAGTFIPLGAIGAISPKEKRSGDVQQRRTS